MEFENQIEKENINQEELGELEKNLEKDTVDNTNQEESWKTKLELFKEFVYLHRYLLGFTLLMMIIVDLKYPSFSFFNFSCFNNNKITNQRIDKNNRSNKVKKGGAIPIISGGSSSPEMGGNMGGEGDVGGKKKGFFSTNKLSGAISTILSLVRNLAILFGLVLAFMAIPLVPLLLFMLVTYFMSRERVAELKQI